MSPAARSVFAFGLYLVLVGVGLVAAPDVVITPLGFPATTDFWPRVAGVLTLCLASYYLLAARAGLTSFFRWTVAVRLGVFVVFGGLALLRVVPAPVAALGAVDLAAALWTARALRTVPGH